MGKEKSFSKDPECCKQNGISNRKAYYHYPPLFEKDQEKLEQDWKSRRRNIMKQNIFKKILITGIAAAVMLCPAFAFATGDKDIPVADHSVVKVESLNLTNNEKSIYHDYQQELAHTVKSYIEKGYSSDTIEDVLTQYICQNSKKNIVTNKLKKLLNAQNDKELLIKGETVDSELLQEYTKKFTINDTMELIIMPTAIYLDEFECGPEIDLQSDSLNKNSSLLADASASDWKTKSAAVKRTLYTTIGKPAASVHTGGKFKYNGKTATYHSDFYGYYKLILTTYKNLSFDKVREPVDSSYQFYAYGTFCKFVEGVSGTTKKISCKVKCSPSGAITKSYYPPLKSSESEE